MSCGNDKAVRLWDTASGRLHPIRYDPCCSSTLKYDIDVVGFSPSSGDELLIYPGTDHISLVPLHSSTGTTVRILVGHLDRVTSVQMLSDYRVISAGEDGMVFLWDGRELEIEDSEEAGDWLGRRKRLDSHEEEVESEEEFIPPILRNLIGAGDNLASSLR